MENRLPSWFKQRLPDQNRMLKILSLVDGLHLHTVCQEARCPNGGECFSRKTATFLILGNTCTRRCTFCAVGSGRPLPVDEAETFHLLEAAEKLDLRYIVITSVTGMTCLTAGLASSPVLSGCCVKIGPGHRWRYSFLIFWARKLP